MKRHQLRQNILLFSYALLFFDPLSEDKINQLYHAMLQTDMLSAEQEIWQITTAIKKKEKEFDEIIKKYLQKWTIHRLPKITLLILRMAFYELKYETELDAPIIIDEAVELAKEYTTQQDAAFINGVLGKYLKESNR